MNYRPTPTTNSGDHARSVTPRMFVPGTVAALNADAHERGRFHRRATLCCGGSNCNCGVPEILRHGRLAGFLGNLGDDEVSFEPSMFDPGSALIEPVFNSPLIPINLTSQPVFETSMFDPGSTLSAPNLITPSRPLQLQPSTSIPGAAAAVASQASQFIRAAAVPTTRALVPASALSPSIGTQLSSALSAQSILPGVSNGALMLLAAAAMLAFSATSGKRR